MIGFYLCLILQGCDSSDGSEKGNLDYQKYNIKNTDKYSPIDRLYAMAKFSEKSFILDDQTSVDKSRFFYYKKSNKLYLLSFLDLSISIYDWKERGLTKKIKLQREGPNGVGSPYTLFVVSPDSIYLVDPTQFRLILVDSTGKICKSYSLLANGVKLVRGEGVLPLMNYSSQIQIWQNKFLIGGAPVDDHSSLRYYTDGETGFSLSLLDGKINSLMAMPPIFVKRYKDGYVLTSQQANFGQTYNLKNGIAIVNFPTENYIYEINLKDRKVSIHFAGSERFKGVEYAKKKNYDMASEFNYYKNQPEFPAIYYDPYKDFYYRFASLPNKNKKDRTDGLPWVHLQQFPLWVFSGHFNPKLVANV